MPGDEEQPAVDGQIVAPILAAPSGEFAQMDRQKEGSPPIPPGAVLHQNSMNVLLNQGQGALAHLSDDAQQIVIENIDKDNERQYNFACKKLESDERNRLVAAKERAENREAASKDRHWNKIFLAVAGGLLFAGLAGVVAALLISGETDKALALLTEVGKAGGWFIGGGGATAVWKSSGQGRKPPAT